MPDVDLKFAYYGYNREDGQYGLHPLNRPIEVSFFQEDMDLRISATDVSSCDKPCLKKSSRVDKCNEMSVMRKRFQCAVLLRY